jgi:DNA-binding transcriptional regulator LsrR (DeoR family)
MVMLAKIRRMHFRDEMSIREIARRTGLSRNTVRRWLRQGHVEPKYPVRVPSSNLEPVGQISIKTPGQF